MTKALQQTPITTEHLETDAKYWKEEPEFKVDLRIGGIAQDVILKDEERMDQIPKVH